MSVLIELGEKYQPTKRYHNYLPLYARYFDPVRFEVKNILEIGVQTNRSVCMWKEYFPHATIHGIDIDERCKVFEEDRIEIYIGDQSDTEFLNKIISLISDLDIVIDDGSHIASHQMLSFKTIFPNIASHGIYVIEDLKGSKEYNWLIQDCINYKSKSPNLKWPDIINFPEDASWWAKNVVGAAFYRDIVFIMKGNNPSDNPYLGNIPKNAHTLRYLTKGTDK